jgi:hypothetical protein
MHSRPVRITMIIVGVIALVMGGLWIGQGLNLIRGSTMTGVIAWLYIGALVAFLGVILLVLGVRRGRGNANSARTRTTGSRQRSHRG